MPTRGRSSEVYRYAGAGLHFSATIGVFALAGYLLDRWLGSAPWLLIVGVFVGFGAGLYSLILKLGPNRVAQGSRPPRDLPPA
jgi:F0F1-type ATP synthase assembly protein I